MIVTLLYDALIRPIEYLIEVVFHITLRIIGDVGGTIIILSIVVSTLTLPLYLRAEHIQQAERRRQDEMKRWMEHIRQAFHGDEKLLILSAYYKEMNYHPMMALKGILPLFFQIPFFMAAYHFLGNLQLLNGCSFWRIKDLGAPDHIFTLNGLTIHLLPLLMTVLNLISMMIYTAGRPWRERIQPGVLALIFLILLYPSPSGLVLYWTMNNLYSLMKNLLASIRWKRRYSVRRVAVGAIIVSNAIYLISGRALYDIQYRQYERLFYYLCFQLVLLYPLAKCWISRKRQKGSVKGFYLPLMLALTLLLGLVIPLSVLSASPLEFYDADRSISPLYYVWTSLSTAAGLFCIWGNVVYYMAGEERQERLTYVMFPVLILSLIDAFCFQADVGRYTTMLDFHIPKYPEKERLIWVLLAFAVLIISYQLLYRFKHIVIPILGAVIFGLAVLGCRGLYQVRTALQQVEELRVEETTETAVIPLSANAKNVVVLMLDCAIAGNLPYLFDEKPILQQQFDGFVYYPNSISHGLHTNYGSPALYGGYDYTPEAINVRSEESLEEKHDEALKVMPVLFGENGYQVTVCNSPYEHYLETRVPDFYDEYSYVNDFDLERALPAYFEDEVYRRIRERNFFFHSIYKVAPIMLQDEIFDDGAYLAAERMPYMNSETFQRAYRALVGLPELTEVVDTDTGCFFLACNNTTHEPVILALPDYDVMKPVENSGYDVYAPKELNGIISYFDRDREGYAPGYYCADMAAMLALGDWFDMLRQSGVYDNTRIILVADHGAALGQFDAMLHEDGIDVEAANPLLMVKDFDSHGFVTDMTLMSNADTPSLAMQGLIEEPLNPFTGNPIFRENREQYFNIIWASVYNINDNHGNVFEPEDARWYHMEGNVLEESDWILIRGEE